MTFEFHRAMQNAHWLSKLNYAVFMYADSHNLQLEDTGKMVRRFLNQAHSANIFSILVVAIHQRNKLIFPTRDFVSSSSKHSVHTRNTV